MNFNRRILIAIKNTTSKLIIGGLLVGIVRLLALRSRSIRSSLIFLISLLVAIVAGGTIGGIVGFLTVSVCGMIAIWMYKLGSKLIYWWVKPMGSGSLYLPPISTLPRSRSPRSQLRIASQRSRDERLSIITESIDIIRVRTPNFSIQDLIDLNQLDLELRQIIDEASWSPTRRARVARIHEIRNSRQANGQTLPPGLTVGESSAQWNGDEDTEITVSYDDEITNTDRLWSGDLDGIGDLTCQYNARSVFIRCAVHPGAETCAGCRDYQPDETVNP
jgi:Family of unknown function (DUF6464)